MERNYEMEKDNFRKGLSIFEMIFALILMYWAGVQPTPTDPPEGTVFIAIALGFLALYTASAQD